LRISSDENDPGYRRDAVHSNVEIRFNGKRVFNVITADDVTGELQICRSSLNGEKPIRVQKDRGAADLYFYKGVVDIRHKP